MFRGGEKRQPGVLRRFWCGAASPWQRIGEGVEAVRREVDALRLGDSGAASRTRLDEDGEFDLDATAFLHGQSRVSFERALAARQASTARYAWIFLCVGGFFFVAWLWRLLTMRWSAHTTVTALQFAPACAVFFLLAFRFGLENYQIRMRRKTTVMGYLTAPRGFWPH